MSQGPALVWFRQDLRLADNPALAAAMDVCSSIIPVFIWAPEEEFPWAPGAASRWWLHQSLLELERTLTQRGAKLVIGRGPSAETLLELAAASGAKSVFWNRRYEPAAIARDTKVKTMLREQGIAAESFSGNLLFEPWTIQNTSGKPFRIFTAFWKACLTESAPPEPKPAPKQIPVPASWPPSLTISDLDLDPAGPKSTIDWAGGLREAWRPGEAGAAEQLKMFIDRAIAAYPVARDRPDESGTSRLSSHLHFGEITPRQIWHAVHRNKARDGAANKTGADVFLREIAWREFAYHQLFHFPDTTHKPLRPEFRHFPGHRDPRALKAWTQGKTGYPLVDAGMRELWHTGWMHNRVRMVVASFLVKHLLLRWQDGAAWFWDTLVDADLANNTLGWQWTAGCGADAAPYFRIFNPVLQGEKFDPKGEYVRRWIPELARLPDRWIHKPWLAPVQVLMEARVELDKNYPKPIVDHDMARKRALESFASLRKS